MGDTSRPPPLRRKAKAPVRHRSREKSPEELKGHARVRAAKLCSASMYVAITGLILMVLPFAPPGGGVAAGLAAVVLGVWGLLSLARLGRPRRDLENATPIERVGARMAARAKGQGARVSASGC